MISENIKKYIDLQCNGDYSLYMDMPEAYRIDCYLQKIKPKLALDIGSGIGRASVYFHEEYKWDRCRFILLDGNSGEKQLDGIRTGRKDYYNSEETTKEYADLHLLKYNYVNSEKDWKKCINEIITEYGGGRIDLAYSFLAFGFHWPIQYYLDDIYPFLEAGCLLIFGLRGTEKKKWVEDQVRAVDLNRFEVLKFVHKPKKTKESVLVIKKI